MLAKSRAEKKTAREAKFSEGSEAFMPDDGSVGDSSSTWGVVNVDSDSADPTEDLRAPSSKLPWAISMFLFILFLSQLFSPIHRSFRKWRINDQLYCSIPRTIRRFA